MHDIEVYNRRLARLAVQMGVPVDDNAVEVPEVDTTGMTPYEKGRCECTLLMSRVREDTKCLDELDASKTADRAAVSNRIRRNLRDLKTRAETLKKDAQKAGRQDDFLEFGRHMKRTENMYKARFRADQGREDFPLGEDSAAGYGTNTSLKTFEEIKNQNSYSNFGAQEEMLDPLQDEEFQQYYQQSIHRDQKIDEGLVRVHESLQRVKVHAQQFSSELETQNAQLENINIKADKLVNEMGSLNTRLKKTLKEVDKEKYCCYMICLLLVLGVLGVIATQTGLLKS